MGVVLVHIKAFKPHPTSHQSNVFTKDVWGQCAVGIPARTQALHIRRHAYTQTMRSTGKFHLSTQTPSVRRHQFVHAETTSTRTAYVQA